MKRSLLRVACVAAIFGLYAACSDNTSVAPKPGLSPSGPAFDFSTPANGSGACMGNDIVTADGYVSNWVSGNPGPTDVNCTSNDISIATTTVVGYSFISINGPFTPLPANGRITCTPGQTIFAQTSAQLQNSAQDRYNIGIWIANDPVSGVEGSAVDGTCFHYNLVPGANGSTQKDGDSCGDMSQGAGLASVDLGALTIVCPAGQATVTVNNCIGWENSDQTTARGSCPNIHPGGAANTISTAQGFRDGTLPETKAKCNCEPFSLPIDVRGKITIVKNTVGGNGSFQFTSDVGSNSDPVVASPFTINTVNNTGSQLIDKVVANAAGQFYHIAESTVDANFTFTSVACTANNAFASATVDQGTKTATITMGNGGDITCTFTNTRNTTLTLVKTVTNNAGGTKTLSDFPLTASGPVTISGVSGGTAVTGRVVNAGTYTLSEQTQTGYTASSWTCTGGTQGGTNSITLAVGGTGSCTINNDDVAPTLTLVKVVTNNAGGTKTLSDFPLTASGPVTISGVSGGTAVTARPVNAGTYTLSEQTQAGYTPTSWTCSGGTQSGTNSIAVGLGGSASCTISNDDIAPTLTLVKVVTNNDGGTRTLSDFPLTASGPVTISGVSGGTAVTARPVNAGTYTLSEQTQTGYTATSWTCAGGTQSGTNSIRVGLGGSASCTISNDDNPPGLTLVKVVTNNAGGTKTLSDFPLTASGPVTISGVSGGTAVTNRPVSAGTYTLSEQTQTGYTATSWTCAGGTQSGTNSIAVANGASASCTISNDDVAPTLTLVKVVTNNSGGTKTTSDFPLTASGPVTISGVSGGTAVTARPVNAGTYTLSEQTQTGYTATSWTCAGGTQSGTNSISLAVGGSASCTISNDDNPATLTLVKVVTNNAGGTRTLSDFPLTASGPVTISGVSGGTAVTARPVNAGTYTLSEQTQTGYTATSWTCSGGTQSGTNSIAVANGGSASCTISNDDIAPTLTLVKVVSNDNGGTKTLSDFPLTASGPVTISGVSGGTAVSARPVNAGTYTLSEQTQTGYTATSWTCSGGTQSGTNSISLALAGSATCTITNNDNPATLIITKSVVGPTSQFCYTDTGTGLVASFCLTPATDNGSISQTFSNLSVGTYTVTEDSKAGYLLTDLGCVGGPILDPNVTRTVSATLALGQTVTCSFVNQFNASTTRTQGFWATHESITNAVWFGGTVGGNTFTGVTDKTLCGRPIDDINKLLGGFWSNIAFTTGKDKRSDLDKARMQLLQQLLAAILNQAAFGSSPSTITLAAAKAAYCGTDISLIKDAQTKLAAFNESGDSGTFTPGASANGKQAKDDANLAFWDILP